MARTTHRSKAFAQRAAAAVLAILLVLGSVRSIARARTWRSNIDVFWTTRRDAPTSFRARFAWGDVLFKRGDVRGGEAELRAAIRIFPNYPYIYEELAHRYREHGLCVAAIPLYETALRTDPQMWSSRQGLAVCQFELAQYRAARQTARMGMLQDDEFYPWFKARLATADSALAATDSLAR